MQRRPPNLRLTTGPSRVVAASALTLSAALGAPPTSAQGAPAVSYEIEVFGAPSEAAEALMRQALLVHRLQRDGAPSLALLRRRAESDLTIVERILRAEGYHRGAATVSVDAPAEADAPATVSLTLTPGPPFILAAHRFEIVDGGAPAGEALATSLNAAELGSPVGARADAAEILAAEAGAVARLKSAGRPYAEARGRRAVANLQTAALTVTTRVSPGPEAVYGPVTLIGTDGVSDAYLLSHLPWRPGETFDDAALARYQRALAATALFDVVAVAKPQTPPAATARGGRVALPVAVNAERADDRTVGAGFRFSTDAGPSARFSFEHRNLFAENERLAAALEIGSEAQEADLGFRKPQFRRSGQTLSASLNARATDTDAFAETAATGALGLERNLDGGWTVGAGALAEYSVIEDDDVDDVATLLGAPLFAAYDKTDDRLNATTGLRARVEATPFLGVFDDKTTEFLTVDLRASRYWRLTDSGRTVFAARMRLATIASASLARIPPPRRLYSGGGGSVRGYAARFAGPLDDGTGDPVGGRSAVELGGEFRVQATDTLGFTVFADAGAVAEDAYPSFRDGVQIGVGPGLRYFSPIGPVGVDVGLPVDPRSEDAPYQLYFFIGQAF